MAVPIDIEIYEIIKGIVDNDKKAREISIAISKVVYEGLQKLEEKADEKKKIIKSEIKDELRKELATKEDILIVEERLSGEIKTVEERLTGEIKTVKEKIKVVEEKIKTSEEKLKKMFMIGFIILGFLIIFLNQQSITFILKILGLLK